jgi:hypothetical protein
MAIAAQSAHRAQAQSAQSARGLLLASIVCDWRSRSRSPSGIVTLGPTVELGAGSRMWGNCGGRLGGGGGASAGQARARLGGVASYGGTGSGPALTIILA